MKNKIFVVAVLLVVTIFTFVACQPVAMVTPQTGEVSVVATEVAEEGHSHEEGGDHSHGDVPEVAEGEVPLMDNLGSHTHTISTDNEMAQAFFNQGLNLAYGFNHEL